MKSVRPLPRRILIVEDEAWIAMDLERVLVSDGYEVVGLAADTATAVRLAGERAPELVLMDIHLAAQSDGVDAAAQIAARFGIRSVFLSAHLDPPTRRRAEATRPVAVLDKPIVPLELLRVLAAALRE